MASLYDDFVPEEKKPVRTAPSLVTGKKSDLYADFVPEKVAPPPSVSRDRGDFSTGVSRGVDQAQSMAGGFVEAAGEATGSKTLTTYGRDVRERNEAEAAESPSNVGGFTDIGKTNGYVSDAVDWAQGTIGELIPQMAPSIAGGVAGAAIGSAFGPVGSAVGGIAGAFVPSAVMGVGETQGEIKARGGTAPGAAFATGTALGLLDAVVPGKLGGRLAQQYGKEAAEELVQKTVGKDLLQNAATEGTTEVLQGQLVELGAALGTDTKYEFDTKQAIDEFAAGALGGGVATGAVRTAGAFAPTRQEAPPPAPPPLALPNIPQYIDKKGRPVNRPGDEPTPQGVDESVRPEGVGRADVDLKPAPPIVPPQLPAPPQSAAPNYIDSEGRPIAGPEAQRPPKIINESVRPEGVGTTNTAPVTPPVETAPQSAAQAAPEPVVQPPVEPPAPEAPPPPVEPTAVGPNDIIGKKGPYSEKGAKTQLARQKRKETHEVVPVEGGFALRPIADKVEVTEPEPTPEPADARTEPAAEPAVPDDERPVQGTPDSVGATADTPRQEGDPAVGERGTSGTSGSGRGLGTDVEASRADVVEDDYVDRELDDLQPDPPDFPEDSTDQPQTIQTDGVQQEPLNEANADTAQAVRPASETDARPDQRDVVAGDVEAGPESDQSGADIQLAEGDGVEQAPAAEEKLDLSTPEGLIKLAINNGNTTPEKIKSYIQIQNGVVARQLKKEPVEVTDEQIASVLSANEARKAESEAATVEEASPTAEVEAEAPAGRDVEFLDLAIQTQDDIIANEQLKIADWESTTENTDLSATMIRRAEANIADAEQSKISLSEEKASLSDDTGRRVDTPTEIGPDGKETKLINFSLKDGKGEYEVYDPVTQKIRYTKRKLPKDFDPSQYKESFNVDDDTGRIESAVDVESVNTGQVPQDAPITSEQGIETATGTDGSLPTEPLSPESQQLESDYTELKGAVAAYAKRRTTSTKVQEISKRLENNDPTLLDDPKDQTLLRRFIASQEEFSEKSPEADAAMETLRQRLNPDADVSYSRPVGAVRKGVPIRQAESTVRRVGAKWKNGPAVKVVQNLRDIPGQANDSKVEGLYRGADNTVYLVAGAIKDPVGVERALLHEAQHFATRTRYGRKTESNLARLGEMISANGGIQKYAKDAGMDYDYDWYDKQFKDAGLNDQQRQNKHVDELLAIMASDKATLGGKVATAAKQILASIRSWLRRNGFNLIASLPNDEMVKALSDTQKVLTGKAAPAEVVANDDVAYSRPADAIEAARASMKERAPLIKQWVKRRFTKEGLLPSKGFQLKIGKDAEINVGEEEISFHVADLQKSLAKAYGKKHYNDLSDDVLSAANSYLQGDKDSNVKESVKPVLDNMRNWLDHLSDNMVQATNELTLIAISNYTPERQVEIKQAIEEGNKDAIPKYILNNMLLAQKMKDNKGKYLNRSYQAFDDQTWKDQVLKNADLMSRAEDYIREQNPKFTPRQVTGAVRAILESAKEAGSMSAMISKGTKIGSKDVSILKKKKDLPPIMLELLGEYTDPKTNFVRSATKMQWYIANHHFLTRFRSEGLNDGFIFKQAEGEFDAKIAADKSDPMNPLNGLHTTPEIKQGMEDAMQRFQGTELMRSLIRVNSMVKYGKAQPLDAKVYTPFGYVAMGSLTKGSVVSTPNGPSTVVDVYPQGEMDVYKVAFKDGTSTEATAEHLWQINSPIKSHNGVFETKDLIKLSDKHLKKCYVPHGMADFEKRDVPLDPYVMGALIGDGSFRNGGIKFTNVDDYVLERFEKHLPTKDIIVQHNGASKCDYVIRRCRKNGEKSETRKIIETLQMGEKYSHEKHVPACYRYNSESVRWAILQGLFDTDGHVRHNDGQPMYYTGSKELASNVQEIIQSLGDYSHVREYISASGRAHYSLSVVTLNAANYFGLPRKKDACRTRKKIPRRRIESIKHVGKKLCQCILIDDQDHLYHTDNFIVTHNTILSPTTQARNFMSAGMFTIMNGHFDWTHSALAYRSMKSDLFTKDATSRKYLRKLIGLGVLHDNPHAQELKAALEDIGELDPYAKGATQKGRQFLKFMQSAYQSGDDFWKVIAFENEAALQEKRGLSREDAEAAAAIRVRDGYPTYSMVPMQIQQIRRWPLIGTFVSFPWEIGRTSVNQLKFIKEDLESGHKEAAARRIVGLSIASTAAWAVSKMSMMAMGMDEDDDEAVRNQLPEWSKNSQLYYMGYDEDGLPQYLDLSYLDPYTYLKKPISAMLNGNNEGIAKKITNAGVEMLAPFVGPDIAAGAIGDALYNTKPNGGQIYNPEAPPWDKARSLMNHFRKAAQPGFMSNMERTVAALKGDVSPSGVQYTLKDEGLGWIGFRVGTLNLRQSMTYKAYGFQQAIRNSTSLLSRVAGAQGHVSDSEVQTAYKTMINARNKAFKDMSKLAAGAVQLGVPRQDVIRSMKAGGVSNANVKYIMNGTVPPWKMSKRFLKYAEARGDTGAPNQERRREFLSDINNRRQIVTQMQRTQQ